MEKSKASLNLFAEIIDKQNFFWERTCDFLGFKEKHLDISLTLNLSMDTVLFDLHGLIISGKK